MYGNNGIQVRTCMQNVRLASGVLTNKLVRKHVYVKQSSKNIRWTFTKYSRCSANVS